MSFKVASWNVNSIRSRVENIIDFINEINPSILLLQELKCELSNFPYTELNDFSYNFYVNGQKSYNGVAILSKFKIDEVFTNFPDNPLPDHSRFIEVVVQTPIGLCRIISLYVPNGGEINSDKFWMKIEFYKAFINYINLRKSFDEILIIGGDFNVAPFDIDVYSAKNLINTTCFSNIEKEQYRSLLNLGLEDLFRLIHPHEQEFSWWDYRAGAFEQNKGMRIDTILSSANGVNFLKDCYIFYKARSKNKPSDHAPIIAEFKS